LEPEKRTNVIVALIFGLVSVLLVSIEADDPDEKTRADLYLRSAQAEARLHAASIAALGDEAEITLPDPFADAEALMAGLQGVGEEARGELLYGMAVAAAAADQPETARLLASRSGAAPEALRPLRFAWAPDSAPPEDRLDLEAAIGHTALTPWSQDRLRILWRQRTGDDEGAEKLRSTQTAADQTWLHELGGLFVLLIILGFVGLAILTMHRRLINRWSEAHPDYLQARFRTTPWETLTLFLLWFVGSQAGGAALGHLLKDMIPKGGLILLVYLFSAALGLAMVYIFGLQGFRRDAATNFDTSRLRDLLNKVNLGSRDLTKRAVLWGLAGFAAALPLVWTLSLLSLVLVGGGTHPAIPIFINSDSTLDRVLLLGTICLLAPIFEEFLFRGFLLNRFNKMLGVYSGTALSALVFAAIHLSLGSFLPLMGLGVILAIIARHSGSLWASVVTHALWNLMNVLFLQLLYR